MPDARPSRSSAFRARGLAALAGGIAACLALSGCAFLSSLGTPEAPAPDPSQAALELAQRDGEIYRQAQAERIRTLEREVARLRADLDEAESAMVAIESGLRGPQTRADAVSALAEARISVERAR